MRRWLAVLALSLGLLVAGGGAAVADLPNPIDPIGDAILDKVCPPKQPPYPASPGAQITARGGGPGIYAERGYAGLTWTTYDAGCLSADKADTAMGSWLNAMANSLDEVTNELQAVALDEDTTTSMDRTIAKAVGGLREAFWNPWSLVGLAAAGLLVAGYGLSGRGSDALGLLGQVGVVLVLLFAIMARPTLPADAGNALTSGVASGVANSLVSVTPGGTMPANASTRERFAEGFYQVSYRAWLEGWSCGDADAERVYGPRLLDAQSFTVSQLAAVRDDPGAARRLVEAKGKAWLAVGEDMARTHPAAFGCWKGEGNSRTGAAVKHAVVSLGAGFWIVLGSVALLALKWVLRLAVLFLVTFGALILFSRRMADRMQEFVLLGLLGPPFVAAGVGTLLWGYYAILLDRTQAWWQAGVFAFALGLAVFMAKGIIQRLFVGTHAVERTRDVLRKGSRRVVNMTHTSGSGTTGAAVAGGLAGGAAGAAVTAVAGHDDARRTDDLGEAAERQGRVDAAATGDDAPAAALARVRQRAAEAGYERTPVLDTNGDPIRPKRHGVDMEPLPTDDEPRPVGDANRAQVWEVHTPVPEDATIRAAVDRRRAEDAVTDLDYRVES
jgi:hypothetical protein